MTIREFYESIGSDFEEALARMMKESLMERLVKKYPGDKSFEKLKEAISKKDFDAAFEAAHTLKGLSLNLGFDSLGKVASEMTEKLRSKNYEGIEETMQGLQAENERVLEAIGKIDGEGK